jgi:hypothetical protein
MRDFRDPDEDSLANSSRHIQVGRGGPRTSAPGVSMRGTRSRIRDRSLPKLSRRRPSRRRGIGRCCPSLYGRAGAGLRAGCRSSCRSRAICAWLEADRRDPAAQNSRVLPRGEMRAAMEPARPEELGTEHLRVCYTSFERLSDRFGDLEPDGTPGLALRDGGALLFAPGGEDVADAQRDQVAAAKLAVYRHVEQREVACVAGHLEAYADRPDVLRLERALLADDTTLVPGDPGRAGRSSMDMVSLQSVRPTLSSAAPTTHKLPRGRWRSPGRDGEAYARNTTLHVQALCFSARPVGACRFG